MRIGWGYGLIFGALVVAASAIVALIRAPAEVPRHAVVILVPDVVSTSPLDFTPNDDYIVEAARKWLASPGAPALGEVRLVRESTVWGQALPLSNVRCVILCGGSCELLPAHANELAEFGLSGHLIVMLGLPITPCIGVCYYEEESGRFLSKVGGVARITSTGMAGMGTDQPRRVPGSELSEGLDLSDLHVMLYRPTVVLDSASDAAVLSHGLGSRDEPLVWTKRTDRSDALVIQPMNWGNKAFEKMASAAVKWFLRQPPISP